MFWKETCILFHWLSLQIVPIAMKMTLLLEYLIVIGICMEKAFVFEYEAKLVLFHRFKKLFELFIFKNTAIFEPKSSVNGSSAIVA